MWARLAGQTCFQEAACASTRLCHNEDLSHTFAEASLDNGAFYYLAAGLIEVGMGQCLSDCCRDERPSTSPFLFHQGTNWKHHGPPVIWTIAGASNPWLHYGFLSFPNQNYLLGYLSLSAILCISRFWTNPNRKLLVIVISHYQ